MRNRTLLVAVAVAVVTLPATLHAGANSGAKAWLSWDSTSVMCDLTEMPAGPTWVYVQLGDMVELSQCEIEVFWNHVGSFQNGCYEFVTGTHPSGTGSDCTWMIRGQQLEIHNIATEYSWYVVSAAEECSTCGTGSVAKFLLDFSSCTGDTPGRICLQLVRVADCSGLVDLPPRAGSLSVLGGVGVECPCGVGLEPWCPGCDWAVSVEGSTWGAVKALYK